MIGNWIDLIIIFYLSIYFINGTRKGVFSILFNVFSFIVSVIIAFYTYSYSAKFFSGEFSLDISYANILGFFINIIIAKIIISTIVYLAFRKSFSEINETKISKIMGGFASFLYGAFVVFLTFSIFLSLSPPYFISKQIQSSTIGKIAANDPLNLNNGFKNIFGDVIKTTIKKIDFLAVDTEDKEGENFDFKISDVKFDEKLELDMLQLINKERLVRKLDSLVIDENIRKIARIHGRDMFENGYFSHTNLEGKNACQRMREGGIEFSMCAENLAFSKDLLSAHEGLMKSPGHRKNILFPFFHRVGIAVVDGGPYGIIFVQDFAD